MQKQLSALLDPAFGTMTNLANASAYLKTCFPRVNWLGFYLLDGETLCLAPFQGKPACVRIRLGRGVCSAAITQRRTIRVDDVTAFPGHIACDAASRAELVVPLFDDSGAPAGVLDVDSAVYARFTEADETLAEAAARIVSETIFHLPLA